MRIKSLYTNATHVLLCTLLSCGGVLQALVPAPEPTQERIEIGTRPFSLIEHTALQELRAKEEEEELAQFKSENPASDEELSKLKNESSASLEDDTEMQAKMFPFTTSNLTTTHAGIYQAPLAVSALGDTVELVDGSIWNVRSNDRYKTFDWLTSDQVIIKPNHSWFSSYHYKLTNLSTKSNVAVNLSLGPIYNGVHTHWIVAIDYQNRQICLEDGTVWSIKKSDRGAMNKWIVNDTVIIGVNDGYFSSKSNPNILINVNVLNYARGAVMY